MSVIDIVEKIKSKQISAHSLVLEYIKQIEKYAYKNAVLEVFSSAITSAKALDEKIAKGEKVGRLAGVPIIIKDNIMFEGHKMTCASKFLKDFVSPYTSTVVKKLLNEDAIILGRANMDEFAMGGTTETSAWGVCLNAHDDKLIPGGSSGGSAVAVALSLCGAALGTDTGGSIRQPASFNGIVGMKPTYGRVSRFGVSAYASSFDQVGPMTKTVKDNALMLSVLAGEDENDQTAYLKPVPNYLSAIKGDVKGVKVGIIKQIKNAIKGGEHQEKLERLIDFLKENGAEIVEIDYPFEDMILPVYYILANAEATSNLARLDGIKYSVRSKDAHNINQVYKKSRNQGFGKEVKRRIMLGNFVLSSLHFDAYYQKAKMAQAKLVKEMESAFENCNVILIPTTLGEAFALSSKINDPVALYLQDLFTAVANITQVPAMSVPYAKGKNNLPLGIQIIAKRLNEEAIYNMGDFIETKFCEVEK